MSKSEKYLLQDQYYFFPYHYLPTIENENEFSLHKYLSWGLEYMTYISFIINFIIDKQFNSLIDVGCGDGRLINLLNEEFSGRLVGIDLSDNAITLAKAFNQTRDFICGDIGDIQEKFQCATLIEVLEHIPDEEIDDFIINIHNVIEPDGFLIVSVPTVNVPINIKHFRHYDLELLTRSLSPFFVIENHWWLYRISFMERIIKKFLCNRFWIINSKWLRTYLWKTHMKTSYFGSNDTGAHLICLARKYGRK
jgi:SAM-dependent methyltransferase